jgi:hypothetical protein
VTQIIKPFARTPGRGAARNRPPFDVARFYYDQCSRIVEDAATLRRLIAAVNWTNDLASPQWAQWYSVALGFAPDLILELGRGYGNSTALFGEAAWRLGHTKVVSLCNSGEWASVVSPKIVPVVDRAWFANIDARRVDILSADYADIIANHQRVLVLLDAHGFEIAELVLGEILPRLVGRPHLVLMHDISDNRYGGVPRSYNGPLWKGSSWQQRTGSWNSRLNIGWMNSIQDQVIALADFSARNDVEIGSSDHEYAQFFAANPAHAVEMRQRLGDEFFSQVGHWAFLSLTEETGPFHFPSLAGWRAAVNRCDIVVDDWARHLGAIETRAVPWAYASTIAWRPAAEPPAGVPSWIRCRVRVESGVAGVSLLAQDERSFVDSQVVSVSPGRQDVLLRAPAASERGRLVIHTWDAPVAARVRIEELALVW